MTQTQLTPEIPNWQKLEGATLEGGYELQKVTEAGPENATIRVRVLGNSLLKASARFYDVRDAMAEEQIAIWESLRALRNAPGLNLPLGAGSIAVDGLTLPYVIMPDPDEMLADGLRERALTLAEAKEVTQSVADGLGVLHANGFVHGRIGPDDIAAIGSSILLTTELVRHAHGKALLEKDQPKYLAPESDGHNITPAADVWCAGATLFESLTQKTYRPELLEDATKLDIPFGAIETQCLEPDPEMRCKITDLTSLLAARVPIQKPARVFTPAPVVTPSPTPTAMPVEAPRLEATSIPELLSRDPYPARRERVAETPARRSWIYLAIGVLVVIGLFWFGKARTRTPVTSQPIQTTGNSPKAASSPVAAPTPAPAAPAPPASRVNSGPAPQVPAASHPSSSRGSANAARNGNIWRVILFTYNQESEAKKKTESLNKKHPELRSEVFSPNGHAGPYLVVAGGRMGYDQARAERQKLIRSGLPHDSYIQNYRQ